MHLGIPDCCICVGKNSGSRDLGLSRACTIWKGHDKNLAYIDSFDLLSANNKMLFARDI